MKNPAFLTVLFLFAALNVSGIQLANAQGSVDTDREALVALYDLTDGDNWRNNSSWKSDRPLGDWWGVDTDSDGRVTRILLDFNDLSGPIPIKIGNLNKLRDIDLSSNKLSDIIPTEIGNLTNLVELDLSNTDLSGSIPTEIGNLTNLTELDLNRTDLSGSIPTEIGNLTNLEKLDLSSTDLSGSIPTEIGNLTNLIELDLSLTDLSGFIPKEIGNLTNLPELDLARLGLSGSIPKEIGNMTNLLRLYLNNNDLSRSIPKEIGNLINLVELDLSHNGLSGPIPPELGNLINLTELDLSWNNLSGSIPTEMGNLINLESLNLALNNLSGPVPLSFANLLLLRIFFVLDVDDDVCIPASLEDWYAGIPVTNSGVPACADSPSENAAPSFTSPATFNAPENQTSVGTVQASDSDSDDSVTGYVIQGGADALKFSIVEASGTLTFASAPNYEAPADDNADGDYVVVVRATSGAGDRVRTADQTITVTVTDVGGEAPGIPVAPFVSSASVTSVTAAWIAPTNAGPPITDYDHRYRVTSPQGAWTEVTNTTTTALSVTITQLVEDTEYDVQVRATNDEGTSGWSDPGTGTPRGATEAGAIANAPENLQATAGNAEVTLSWDAPLNDGGANITGYAYRYKESGGDFIAYTDIPESGPGQANARSYTIPGLTNGVEYVFHVRALNEHGGGLPAVVTVLLPGVVSTESDELPTEAMLWGNYPNPFNPETTIRYALPQTGDVRLAVYDLMGHEVAVLVDGSQSAGNHTVRFGADNLPSGLYVYRLQAQGKTIVRTMMLVK